MPLDALIVVAITSALSIGLVGWAMYELARAARALRPQRVESLDDAPLDSLWIDDPFFDERDGMDELLDDVPYAERAFPLTPAKAGAHSADHQGAEG